MLTNFSTNTKLLLVILLPTSYEPLCHGDSPCVPTLRMTPRSLFNALHTASTAKP